MVQENISRIASGMDSTLSSFPQVWKQSRKAPVMLGCMTSIYGKHYERVKDPTPIILTERDEEIIRAVGRFRFLRSDQITKLFRGSKQAVIRRLGKLFHHGYLARPTRINVQIAIPGYKGMVYALGPSGRKYLASQGVLYSYRQQEKIVKILYLAHTLKVADFIIDLQLSLPDDVELYHGEEFRILFNPKRLATWRVPIEYGDEDLTIGVVPDYLFALVRGDETCVYCLEMDRGTMPVYRERPIQTSFVRKIIAYHETWKTGFALENFDWKRFRVVTVTSSSERKNHLISACQRTCKDEGGEKLFLFATENETRASEGLYHLLWSTGKGREFSDQLLS
jgi:hypothetical protein